MTTYAPATALTPKLRANASFRDEVIVNERCPDFEVQQAGIDQFASTQRSKVPVLYLHGIS